MSKRTSIFSLAEFRRLVSGVTTSHLGDQFALVATPWLVLQLTGDPFALGLVLALEGAPRALFMLVGGAITDRVSPRLVLLASDILRCLLAGLLAFAVLTGQVEMWMVYSFALGIGLVAGFAVPAGNSIVPMIVGKEDLRAANATLMGGGQIAGIVGPVIAGILIGTLSSGLDGVGIALLIDAMTFAFSALMMWLMRSMRQPVKDQNSEGSLASAVHDGIRYVWARPTLRLTLLIIAAINLICMGPLLVGIPVLAEQRLAEGAGAFGLLISCFAGGNLGGYVLAGAMSKPSPNWFRWLVLLLLAGFAATLLTLGYSASTWIDGGALLVLGIGNGYATIVLISAIQSATPETLLGRVMGLFMFSSMGLVPISQAAAGAISRSDLTLLFTLSAGLMVIVAAWSAFQPALSRLIGDLTTDETRDTQTASAECDHALP